MHYEPEELVMLNTRNLRGSSEQGARKLKPRFMGPFKVQRMVGNAAVKLELPSSWSRIHDVLHVSLVKPYYSKSGEPSTVCPPKPVQWLKGEPIFTVDKLLGHRFVGLGRRKKLEYLVRWKDYGPENDTWEPRKNLLTCNAEIRAYKAKRGLEISAFDEEDSGVVLGGVHML